MGAILGLIIGRSLPPLELFGGRALGSIAAIAAGLVAAIAAGVGYWRAWGHAGQEWRQSLSMLTSTVNMIAVTLVHAVLAVLATLAAFLVLSLGLIG